MRILSRNLEMTKMMKKKMNTGPIFQTRTLILRIRKKKRLLIPFITYNLGFKA
jgi:hypothetical protein